MESQKTEPDRKRHPTPTAHQPEPTPPPPRESSSDATADGQHLSNMALLNGMRYYKEQLSSLQRQFLENSGLPVSPPPQHRPPSNVAQQQTTPPADLHIKTELDCSVSTTGVQKADAYLSVITESTCSSEVVAKTPVAAMNVIGGVGSTDSPLRSTVATPPALIDRTAASCGTEVAAVLESSTTPNAVSRNTSRSTNVNDRPRANNNEPDEVERRSSNLLLVANAETGRSQTVFICSINGRLNHGEQIHIVTGDGEVHVSHSLQLGGEAECALAPATQVESTFGQQEELQSQFEARNGENHSSSETFHTPPQRNDEFPSPSTPFFAGQHKSRADLANESREDSNQTINEIEAEFIQRSKAVEEYSLQQKYPRGKLSSSSMDLAERKVDGINLDEIKKFAKLFKLKRLSLGLTQTQVGQALSLTEGPAYSQSAICRFEKLDITPRSAQKIQPVLAKWIEEINRLPIGQGQQQQQWREALTGSYPLCQPQSSPTEAGPSTSSSLLTSTTSLSLPTTLMCTRRAPGAAHAPPHSVSTSPPTVSPSTTFLYMSHGGGCSDGGTTVDYNHRHPFNHRLTALDGGKKRKRRTSFTPQALEILGRFFQRNTHPTGAEMTLLAENLNYDREVVRVWFCNKRQALKNAIKKMNHQSLDDVISDSPPLSTSNAANSHHRHFS